MEKHTVTYPISEFLINAQGKLGLYHLLNILQDAAASHAHELNFGVKEMERMKMFWVLTRQNLIMNTWPKWRDEVRVETWVRLGSGATSNRDFKIYLQEKLIGECTTGWLALSSETRRPVDWDKSSVMDKLRSDDKVSIDTLKIPQLKDSKQLITFKVRNSDIDQNMHVNNTKYAQWVLDAVPFKNHWEFDLTGYAVNFLAETKLDDVIRIEQCEGQFQGIRESDGKTVFTSQLSFLPRG